MIWPWKTKKQKQQEMWDILQGKPDPNAIRKIVDQIKKGNIAEVERLTEKLIDDKVREIERDNSKI